MKQTKICFACGVRKELTNFYAHPGMADGCLGKCKECCKKAVRQNYRDNFEYYQAYDRSRRDLPHRVAARAEYAASEEGRDAGNKAKKAWEHRNPDKKKAATAVSNAVRDGKLTRGTVCERCESTQNIEAHHEDYSKPFDIEWLCKKCHWQADEARRTREKKKTPRSVPREYRKTA